MGRALALWSGGKDSCLAYYKALEAGYKVFGLLNFIGSGGNSLSHGVPGGLIALQARAMDIPLHQRKVEPGAVYREEFIRALRELGPSHLICGDIELEEHRVWLEETAAEAGVAPVFPLWRRDPWGLIAEFLSAGFESVVVSLKAGVVSEAWLGKPLDGEFLRYLREHGIHPCGEGGEFHTLVVAGPIFRGRIRLEEARPVLREGHWFLEIADYRAE